MISGMGLQLCQVDGLEGCELVGAGFCGCGRWWLMGFNGACGMLLL